MGSVVLDEPSLGLPPVLVTETFRFPMSPLGHKRRVEARQAGSAVPPAKHGRQRFLQPPSTIAITACLA
jgi:hypothetical protein